jgi:hypothetical protein
MKSLLILSVITSILIGCSKEQFIDTSSFEGTYYTNGFLDFACVALPPDKMPVLHIDKTSANQYTLRLTRFFPEKRVVSFKGVTLKSAAKGQDLYKEGQKIGSWGILFKESTIIRLEIANPEDPIYFVGEEK